MRNKYFRTGEPVNCWTPLFLHDKHRISFQGFQNWRNLRTYPCSHQIRTCSTRNARNFVTFLSSAISNSPPTLDSISRQISEKLLIDSRS